ncbi:MAG TPA: ATP-binding cassette domain-containing protein [Pedomonas sp.]|uniref:ATP-binding cassette domain-containing protein n=1 Tax=Pedomonas sp. TaxID=2976421 RepID=UPI002F42E4F5
MSAPILSLEQIGIQRGEGWLFRSLDLFIGEKDRLALVGRNGAGKSTLLSVIAGSLELDEGRRVVRPRARVVLLEQDPPVEKFATLREFALSQGDQPMPPEPHEVAKVAEELGVDLDRPAATASGGEKRRAAIARALALDPDVLLLDEPTNHLDLAAIAWLEGRLRQFTGAFVVISHDRMFLSRLTRSTIWLDRGTVRRAEVGFGGFEAWQEKAEEEEARVAERLDAKLKLELHWLQRGVTARRKRNMGRLRKLQDMRAQRRAMTGPQGVANLALNESEQKSKTVIDAENVSITFGERTIFKNFNIKIQKGDRIGIVGPNGAGKTTLLKLLTGELQPDEGSVRIAKTLDRVIVDQARRLLEPGKSVRDILADGGDWIEVNGSKKHVSGYLKEFLFDPSLLDAKIETLSGGEQSRILLAREFARPSNLLVLDEPTNDLDLETLDLLQEIISEYQGTVLLVSHDRDFLDRTVTMVIGLDGTSKVDVVVGGYSDWEAKRQPSNVRSISEAKKSAPPAPAAPKKQTKLSYKDQRELDNLPAEIEQLGTKIQELEAKLADPELYTKSPDKFAKFSAELEATRDKLAEREERWLELEEMVENLGS